MNTAVHAPAQNNLVNRFASFLQNEAKGNGQLFDAFNAMPDLWKDFNDLDEAINAGNKSLIAQTLSNCGHKLAQIANEFNVG